MPTLSNPIDRGAGAAGVLTGAAFLTAIIGAMRLAESPIPRPGAPAADIRRYYTGSATAVRFSATGQAVSILALARFTRSVARLAAQSPRRPRALQTLAWAGGVGAVASLAASAATHVALTAPAERDDERVRTAAGRVFALGGPVHGVAFGALVAALALSAKDAGLFGRGFVSAGLGSAAAGLLSPAYFAWEPAGWLIPIGRFSGYVLSGIAGVRMASRRG